MVDKTFELYQQAVKDWKEHAGSPYERYLELKLQHAHRDNVRLCSALQFIANHEAPEGSALETVVRFAKLAIEVKE